MLYAKNENGEKVSATPHLTGKNFCPGCGELVLKKCGSINIWHFAHDIKSECNYKPETDWHLTWKSYFKKENVEVFGPGYRADVMAGDTILEFQNSPISTEEIKDRERKHSEDGKRTLWVVNAEDFQDRFCCMLPSIKYKQLNTIKYKWPKKYVSKMSKVMFHDTRYGDNLLAVTDFASEGNFTYREVYVGSLLHKLKPYLNQSGLEYAKFYEKIP